MALTTEPTAQVGTTSVVIDSPLGSLYAVAEAGALTWLSFGESARAPYRDGPAHPADATVLTTVRLQLEEYFHGERREFDLPLRLAGTEFQRRVWAALVEIPYGATVGYAELAARIGRTPGASRAVGSANGANPVSVIVPCHRVVGANGDLTGYAWGVDRKERLLALEKESRPQRASPIL